MAKRARGSGSALTLSRGIITDELLSLGRVYAVDSGFNAIAAADGVQTLLSIVNGTVYGLLVLNLQGTLIQSSGPSAELAIRAVYNPATQAAPAAVTPFALNRQKVSAMRATALGSDGTTQVSPTGGTLIGETLATVDSVGAINVNLVLAFSDQVIITAELITATTATVAVSLGCVHV